MNKINNLSFFSYKDPNYHGSDMFGISHIIYLIIALISVITLVILLRKVSHQKITKYLQILAIIMPIWEIIKIIWETSYYFPIHHDFEWSGLLPLYLCSLFIYVLPFAGYGKGQVKQCALGFLCTLGIVGGLVNFIMPPILNSYAFFTYPTFVSLIYHYLMVFTGLWLWTSGYYKPLAKDEIKAFIPVLIFSVIVIPINYLLQYLGYHPDYMLYMSGSGAPLLPLIANFFSKYHLRLIYTLIMVVLYFGITVLIIKIAKIMIKLIAKKAKV